MAKVNRSSAELTVPGEKDQRVLKEALKRCSDNKTISESIVCHAFEFILKVASVSVDGHLFIITFQ